MRRLNQASEHEIRVSIDQQESCTKRVMCKGLFLQWYDQRPLKYSRVFIKGNFEKMGFCYMGSPLSRKLSLLFSLGVMLT